MPAMPAAALRPRPKLNPLSAIYWQEPGRASLQAGDLKRAEYALHRSVGVDPLLPETHLLIGYVSLKQGRLQDALAAFRQASAWTPRSVSVCMIGYTYEKMGRTDLAMSSYSRAMKLQPGDDMARQLMAEIDK